MDAPYSDHDYQALAEKLMNGTITPEEKSVFINWYNQFQDEPIEIPEEFAASEQALQQRIYKNINKRKVTHRVGHRKIYKYLAAASVILMTPLLVVYFNKPLPVQSVVAKAKTSLPVKANIVAGSDKAVLSLADGSQILLDSASNGTLSTQGNTQLVKVNGQLSVLPGKATSAGNFFNTISTPRGGQYKVLLADGTIVWLNAASSLVFPAAFSGSERRVELKGEAYFEVAKNPKHPFIVTVNDMKISVLGTHFNVKAYDDENNIKTTLMEGSVKLDKQNRSVILTPGQEASVSNSSTISVLNDVDVKQAVAWKNGLFEFDDTIEEIMRQIARWYDVDVDFEGKVTDKSFGATIARKENISDVLQLLEMTGSIHFKIEGRSITVMP